MCIHHGYKVKWSRIVGFAVNDRKLVKPEKIDLLVILGTNRRLMEDMDMENGPGPSGGLAPNMHTNIARTHILLITYPFRLQPSGFGLRYHHGGR